MVYLVVRFTGVRLTVCLLDQGLRGLGRDWVPVETVSRKVKQGYESRDPDLWTDYQDLGTRSRERM